MKRLPLVASFLLFIALCASAAYWGMQLFKPPLRPVAAPPRVAQAEIRTEAASGLFGGRRANVAVASNYQLKGVIFSGSPRDSVAILSADGNPAQAVRVNMEVVPGVTVKEVHQGYVLLAEGGVTKRVELPEDARGQGSMSFESPGPGRPSAATQRQFVPPRAQAVPAAPTPTIPSPPPAMPGQVQVPVQGQIPSAQALPQVPGQVPGQTQAQTPIQPTPMTAAPPTVVVSPPPGGQAGAAANVPVAPVATPNQGGMPAPANPQTAPGTTVVPGSQQLVPGVPVTR